MKITEVKRICGECLKYGMINPIYNIDENGKITEHIHEDFIKKAAILNALKEMNNGKIQTG